MQIPLSGPQWDFVNASEQFPAMVAGFGAGKTQAGVWRAIVKKLAYPKQNVAYYLPTYDLVARTGFPRFEEIFDSIKVLSKVNKNDAVITVANCGEIIFRTMDNPARIVSFEVADSIVDELDTLPTEKASEVWNKVISRNRQKKPDGALNTVGVATTPEGFRFVYDRWVKKGGAGYRLIKATTQSNSKNLPAGYIASLEATYPPNLLLAYLGGEFVNLTTGSVYAEFDRNLNACDTTVKPGETLHVGMDFNVAHGAAVVHVLREDNPHAVFEYTEVLDTPAMILLLKRDWPGNPIMVYPDASGGSRKSTDASQSDLSLLKGAGFRICSSAANPAVKDRVLAVNLMINKQFVRRYRVNPELCPMLVESLEKQAYNKHGEPDKSAGLDHVVDAAGYMLVYRYPIVKRLASVSQFRM